MPYVTKEQIAAAKQMCAMEFLRKYRPGELVPGGAKGEFQLKAHDSFKINGETSLWHWKSRDIGGRKDPGYLVPVEGTGFVGGGATRCGGMPGVFPALGAPRR